MRGRCEDIWGRGWDCIWGEKMQLEWDLDTVQCEQKSIQIHLCGYIKPKYTKYFKINWRGCIWGEKMQLGWDRGGNCGARSARHQKVFSDALLYRTGSATYFLPLIERGYSWSLAGNYHLDSEGRWLVITTMQFGTLMPHSESPQVQSSAEFQDEWNRFVNRKIA